MMPLYKSPVFFILLLVSSSILVLQTLIYSYNNVLIYLKSYVFRASLITVAINKRVKFAGLNFNNCIIKQGLENIY